MFDNKVNVTEFPQNIPPQFVGKFLESTTFPKDSYFRISKLFNDRPYLPGKNPRRIFPNGADVWNYAQIIFERPTVLPPGPIGRYNPYNYLTAMIDAIEQEVDDPPSHWQPGHVPNIFSSDNFSCLDLYGLQDYLFQTLLTDLLKDNKEAGHLHARWGCTGPYRVNMDTALPTYARGDISYAMDSFLRPTTSMQVFTAPEDWELLSPTYTATAFGKLRYPWYGQNTGQGNDPTYTVHAQQVTSGTRLDSIDGSKLPRPVIDTEALKYQPTAPNEHHAMGFMHQTPMFPMNVTLTDDELVWPILDFRGELLREAQYKASPYPGYLGLDAARYVPHVSVNTAATLDNDSPYRVNPDYQYINDWIIVGTALYYYFEIFLKYPSERRVFPKWRPSTKAEIDIWVHLMNVKGTHPGPPLFLVNNNDREDFATFYSGLNGVAGGIDREQLFTSFLQFDSPEYHLKARELFIYADIVKPTWILDAYYPFVANHFMDNIPPVVTSTTHNPYTAGQERIMIGAKDYYLNIDRPTDLVKVDGQSIEYIELTLADPRNELLKLEPNSTTTVQLEFYTTDPSGSFDTSVVEAM